jgi:hypothetical protein
VRAAEARARVQLDLRRAARLARADAPGARAVALPYDKIWARGAVAWEWHLPLRDVGELHHPPPGSRLFAFMPRSRRFAAVGSPLVTTRRWRVLLDLRTSQAAARRGPG